MKKLLAIALVTTTVTHAFGEDLFWYGFSRQGATYYGQPPSYWAGKSLSGWQTGAWGPEISSLPRIDRNLVFGWAPRYWQPGATVDSVITNTHVYFSDWAGDSTVGASPIAGRDLAANVLVVESGSWAFEFGSHNVFLAENGNGLQVGGYGRGNSWLGGSNTLGWFADNARAEFNGGTFDTSLVAVGSGPGLGRGTMILNGSHVAVRPGGVTLVGYRSQGELELRSGATLSNPVGDFLVGFHNAIYSEPYTSQYGKALLTGSGTQIDYRSLTVGLNAPGTLDIVDNAIAHAGSVYVGVGLPDYLSHAVGDIHVGTGGSLTASDSIWLGGDQWGPQGVGTMTVGLDGVAQVGHNLAVNDRSILAVTDNGQVTIGSFPLGQNLGAVTVGVGGTLLGTGTVQARVINAGGTISPGRSPGLLTIDGDLALETGLLLIELGGLSRGREYDALDVTGLARLGGTLRLQLVNGYTFHSGDTFEILHASALSGSFLTIEAPAGFEVRQGANGITVAAVPEPAAFVVFAAPMALMALRRRIAHACLGSGPNCRTSAG